ncbi:MAG: hypothetical protein JSU86_20310, partial [Phycisphaerales bacterium]
MPLLLKLIYPAKRGNDALAYAPIDAFIVDDLQILVTAGLFGSDEHAAPPISTTNTRITEA